MKLTFSERYALWPAIPETGSVATFRRFKHIREEVALSREESALIKDDGQRSTWNLKDDPHKDCAFSDADIAALQKPLKAWIERLSEAEKVEQVHFDLAAKFGVTLPE